MSVAARQRSPTRRQLLCLAVSATLAAASAPLPPPAAAATLDGPGLRGLEERAADDADGAGGAPFRDIGDGVLVQDVISPPRGDGLAVGPGSSVTVKYVLRRSNGYLIYASYGGLGGRDEDFVFRMGQGNAVPGFEKALLGLAAGSRRRFVLPAALGYAPGGTRPGKSPGPLPPDWGSRRSIDSHCREPLLFEVLVSRVRP